MPSSGQVTLVLTCKSCYGMHLSSVFGNFSVLFLGPNIDEALSSILVTTCNVELGWLSGSTDSPYGILLSHSIQIFTLFACTVFLIGILVS